MRAVLYSTLALLFSVSTTVNAYDSSLADCKTVASLFRNTCTTAPDSPANWKTNFAASNVTCS